MTSLLSGTRSNWLGKVSVDHNDRYVCEGICNCVDDLKSLNFVNISKEFLSQDSYYRYTNVEHFL